MNLNFGEILTKAWKIIWKHKVLWIFGILASCAQGGGGNSGGSGNSSQGNGNNFQNFDPNNSQFTGPMEEMVRWFSEHLAIVIALACVLILLSLLFTFIGYVGKIALIKGAYKAENGAEQLTFSELWKESLPYFWRVFGLAFLVGLAILLLIALPIGVIAALTAGIGVLCILPLICLLIPAAIVWSMFIEQTNAAIVLENLSMVDGLKRGWEIFKANWSSLLIMWLILGVGGGIIGVLIALPILIAVLPAIMGIANGSTNSLLFAGLCFVAYLPVLITLQGILIAYVQTSWTLTFMQLTKPSESPTTSNTPIIAPTNA
jgi:hypothetical protein